MSDFAVPETLDIYTKRVLAKAELFREQKTFQERYVGGTATGTKSPLRLFIINHGATETAVPNTTYGSPVKCVKLCKRILDGAPENTIICTQKSRVVINYELVLLVEFEDNTFDVLTLPRNLSSRLNYSGAAPEHDYAKRNAGYKV